MSIISWVENGRKKFAVCESKYFDQVDRDFPVYESCHRSFQRILAFADEEVFIISGDRKKYRRLQPIQKHNASGSRSSRQQRKSA